MTMKIVQESTKKARMNHTNLSMFWALLYLEFFEVFVSGSDG